MDIYREQLLDNYQNPRNFREIIDADAIMEMENTHCGDRIKVFVNVEDGKIVDASFDGEGCAIAIASASMLTEYIRGKTVADVKDIDIYDWMDIMDVRLTTSRAKCASLSLESVRGALEKGPF
ncbi:MAG: iron-sulfur cluster assembly scaffold protein [Candidatus Dojkabacteria bacterium]